LASISEGGGLPPDSKSDFGLAIDKEFGSFDTFVSEFIKATQKATYKN